MRYGILVGSVNYFMLSTPLILHQLTHFYFFLFFWFKSKCPLLQVKTIGAGLEYLECFF